MDPLLRALAIFFFLMLVFRLSGKRTLKDISIFDFVLLLIISESVQQALLDEDYSLTNGFVVISAYVLLDIGFSYLKRSKSVERVLDGLPLVIVENGNPMRERMQKSRVDDDDVLEVAREVHGLTSMKQIRYAVLEKSGNISIIPKEKSGK
jgi:uncharacterized membrane protein YcaP (DUF421 family)